MIRTGNPSLDQACERLDRAGAAWDKAFRQFNDEPTQDHMRVFQAAQRAYTQAQRTYVVAVTVSQLPHILPGAQPCNQQ